MTFKLAPVLVRKGIAFVHASAYGFDLQRRVVIAGDRELSYDRLVVSTGPASPARRSPALAPRVATPSRSATSTSRSSPATPGALSPELGTGRRRHTQGGSCFGASHEFLLNTRYHLSKAGLAERVPMTFIPSGPFLGHFGLGGVGDSAKRVTKFFDCLGIRGIANSSIDEVRDGEIQLAVGEVLPFAFAMIVPPFTGVDAVASTPGLGNAAGFIP